MFEVGFSEMALTAIVALIVLGPERLPRAARFVGLWVRRVRAYWFNLQSELEREIADEEVRKQVAAARAALREAGRALQHVEPDAPGQDAAHHTPPAAPETPTQGPPPPGTTP